MVIKAILTYDLHRMTQNGAVFFGFNIVACHENNFKSDTRILQGHVSTSESCPELPTGISVY